MAIVSARSGRPAVGRTGPAEGEPVARVGRTRLVVGVVFVAVVVAAAVVAIARDRHSFVQSLHDIGVWAVLASGIAGLLSISLTFLVWRAVLGGLGVELPLGPGSRVFFVSQLGKYLPGSVWPVLAQMEAGRSHGASRRTMLTANAVTLVLSCAVGLVLACVLLPLSDASALSRYWWLLIALPFLLALLHPRAIPMVVDKALALVGREPVHQQLPLRAILAASGWSVLSFLALGLHVAILTAALGGWSWSSVLLSTGGMALAICAGVLFLPAMAGAGIREIVLRVVLVPTLTAGQALAVVVVSRVLLTVVDLLLAAAASLARRRRRGRADSAE